MNNKNKHSPSTAILLASYNGDKFLAEQLQSLRLQEAPNLTIFISDDGSVDRTLQVIEEHRDTWNENSVQVRQGQKKGYACNFMSLLCAPDIDADYFAFADQDDIWESDKLSRAITQLQKTSNETPALYCSRSQLIDSADTKIGLSPLFKKKPSFQNALVQCIAGGNTMVMNKAARNLLWQAGNAAIFAHDWWAYILITGAGGTVFYDSHPTIRYRQHLGNVLGRNNDWTGRKQRMRVLFQGGFRQWNTLNCTELQQHRHLLTPESQQILDAFFTARNQWLLPRLWGMWRSGVYRQTLMGNLGLFIATLFKKI